MVSLAIALLSRIWPYLLGAMLLGAVAYKANRWCNSACKAQTAIADKATARADAADKVIAAARVEESRIRLAWAAESVAAQTAAIAAKGKIDATFTPLTDRARSLPAGSGIRFSGAAVGVLGDAAVAANANATAAPAGDQAPASPVPGAAPPASFVFDEREFTVFVVTAAMAYADAVNQWGACVNFYATLQQAQKGTQ